MSSGESPVETASSLMNSVPCILAAASARVATAAAACAMVVRWCRPVAAERRPGSVGQSSAVPHEIPAKLVPLLQLGSPATAPEDACRSWSAMCSLVPASSPGSGQRGLASALRCGLPPFLFLCSSSSLIAWGPHAAAAGGEAFAPTMIQHIREVTGCVKRQESRRENSLAIQHGKK